MHQCSWYLFPPKWPQMFSAADSQVNFSAPVVPVVAFAAAHPVSYCPTSDPLGIPHPTRIPARGETTIILWDAPRKQSIERGFLKVTRHMDRVTAYPRTSTKRRRKRLLGLCFRNLACQGRAGSPDSPQQTFSRKK